MRDIFLSRPQAREHLVFSATFAPNVFINAPVRTKRTAAKTRKGMLQAWVLAILWHRLLTCDSFTKGWSRDKEFHHEQESCRNTTFKQDSNANFKQVIMAHFCFSFYLHLVSHSGNSVAFDY